MIWNGYIPGTHGWIIVEKQVFHGENCCNFLITTKAFLLFVPFSFMVEVTKEC